MEDDVPEPQETSHPSIEMDVDAFPHQEAKNHGDGGTKSVFTQTDLVLTRSVSTETDQELTKPGAQSVSSPLSFPSVCSTSFSDPCVPSTSFSVPSPSTQFQKVPPLKIKLPALAKVSKKKETTGQVLQKVDKKCINLHLLAKPYRKCKLNADIDAFVVGKGTNFRKGSFAKGGSAFVYRLKVEGQDYAVKVLKKKWHDIEVLQEVTVMRRVTKKNKEHLLMGLISFFLSKTGIPVFVMKFMERGTLKSEIELRFKDAPQSFFTFPEVLHVYQNILEALAFMNKEGLVHRDLKPENVMLDSEGTVVLADFGQSTYNCARDLEWNYGSLAFSPPELWGEKDAFRLGQLSVTTDVYSLGVILGSVLTLENEFPIHFEIPLNKYDDDLRQKILDWFKAKPTLVEFLKKFDATYASFPELVYYFVELDPSKRPTPKEQLAKNLFPNIPRQKIQQSRLRKIK